MFSSTMQFNNYSNHGGNSAVGGGTGKSKALSKEERQINADFAKNQQKYETQVRLGQIPIAGSGKSNNRYENFVEEKYTKLPIKRQLNFNIRDIGLLCLHKNQYVKGLELDDNSTWKGQVIMMKNPNESYQENQLRKSWTSRKTGVVIEDEPEINLNYSAYFSNTSYQSRALKKQA